MKLNLLFPSEVKGKVFEKCVAAKREQNFGLKRGQLLGETQAAAKFKFRFRF